MFLNLVYVFSLFHYYLPIEKSGALHLNKIKFSSPNDEWCQVWSKLAKWFWRRSIFFISSMFFRYFVIFSSWKRTRPFIWINLIPLHPKMLCVKFGWNWPSGSGEDFFKNFVKVFMLFRKYLPLENGGALHINKFESPPHPPQLKDALCQVWLKLAKWFWRRRLLNIFNKILLFCNYLPLGEGRGHSIDQTWIPSSQGCFMPSLVGIGPVVLENKN